MKKFLGWLFLVVTVVLISDRVLSIGMYQLYTNTQTTDEYKLTTAIKKTNAPILFMGSSRCHHSYIPSIIGDTLNEQVYNAGLWGERNIYFQYGLLCNLLSRYTPRVICLELHPVDFYNIPSSDLNKVSVLAPFIGYSTECDSLLKLQGDYYLYKIFHLYRFNGGLISMVAGNLGITNSQKDNGYKPLFGEISNPVIADEYNFPLDKDRIHIFENFIHKCQTNNIKLVLLCSPMYTISPSCKKVYHFISDLAYRKKLIFLNHLNDERFVGKTKFFYDRGHLNNTGAKNFSSIIAKELKSIL